MKKVKFNTHYFLAIILATKCLINFLPNHRNKNVDVFIVLVIDVFVQIIVPWRISILLEK